MINLYVFSPTGEPEETDIVNEDAMECKISSNSYKLKFVGGGRSFFYRKKSLPKARQVRQVLNSLFKVFFL
jgi:hypothetical protein